MVDYISVLPGLISGLAQAADTAAAASGAGLDPNKVALMLSAALGLSLVVERVIEFGKNIVEVVAFTPRARASDAAPGESATQELAQRMALDNKLAEVEGAKNRTEARQRAEELVAMEQAREPAESVPTALVMVDEATDPDDGGMLRTLILQIIGLVAGILAARLSGLTLFTTLTHAGEGFKPWMDFVLTGLLIGGGSQPIHVLIRMLGEPPLAAAAGAESAPADTVAAAAVSGGGGNGAAAAAVVSVSSDDDDWVDIPYDGGVDVAKLESVHRRPDKPNLIVYHHTAMPSTSSFDDVVRVIQERRTDGVPWITGYHCVITSDGGIHPFCRWDRYGNHVAGFNLRSLGIAFNGNYETNPSVPNSNPNGEYGPVTPGEAQLDAGARVVALWVELYGIRVQFGTTIVSHNQLNPAKACPGSRFPHEEFEARVKHYVERFRTAAGKKHVEAFRLKSCLGL